MRGEVGGAAREEVRARGGWAGRAAGPRSREAGGALGPRRSPLPSALGGVRVGQLRGQARTPRQRLRPVPGRSRGRAGGQREGAGARGGKCRSAGGDDGSVGRAGSLGAWVRGGSGSARGLRCERAARLPFSPARRRRCDWVEDGAGRMEILMTVSKFASICTMVGAAGGGPGPLGQAGGGTRPRPPALRGALVGVVGSGGSWTAAGGD